MKTSMMAWVLALCPLLLLACKSQEASEPAEVAAAENEAAETAYSEPPPQKPAPVPAAEGQLDPRVVYRVPLQGDEPQRGPDEALVTIVEFGDFDCPFCRKRAPTMDELLAAYEGKLRVVWLNYPLDNHRNARPAATAALEAQAQKGDEGFWAMHDKLFENQGQLHRENLERFAKELGLNMRKFRRALDNDKYAERIDRDIALGKKLSIPGTPSYFMNGRFMAGFPFQTWAGAIDRRMPPLRNAVAEGVPPAELYDRIVAEGKESP